MQLDVSKALHSPGAEFPFAAEGVLPPQDVIGETVTFDPVSLKGHYSALDGTVRLAGELMTTARAACAMCLAPVSVPLTVGFDETFRKDANEIQDEAFRYEGSKVTLDQLSLTLVMLNLPMRFVCGRPDCHAGVALKAWNEEEKTWAENDGETATYRPFEGLDVLLDEEKREH